MAPNAEPEKDFPWWLVILAVTGLWLLYKMLADPFYAGALTVLSKGLVVTLGGEGCEVWEDGRATRVPGTPATAVLDPTGCGDAFRAALLHGLSQGWDLRRCAELGNRMGAAKIATHGPQNYAAPV